MQTFQQRPTDPSFVQNPYPTYARIRAAGDLVAWADYGMICATSYAAVDTILRDRRFGREVPPEMAEEPADHIRDFARVDAHSMLELEPPRHTRLRGLVLRAFTSRRIAALAPEIHALAHQLIDDLPEPPFDILPTFAEKLPVIIIARLLGVPDSMADDLLRWSHAMVAMYQAGRTRLVEEKANAAAREFTDFLTGYINKRRATPADDLITHLIAAEEDGDRLSTDELISTVILLLNAGHEATVHTIGNGLAALLGHGDTVTNANAVTAAEEILRYDPPLHMFSRYAYEPVTLFGHEFERGDEVGLLLGSANRDPEFCENPDVFNIHRPATRHTSFGAGLHFCVGAPLARLELQIALPILFERLPNIALSHKPHYANSYHFHGLERLLVTT